MKFKVVEPIMLSGVRASSDICGDVFVAFAAGDVVEADPKKADLAGDVLATREDGLGQFISLASLEPVA